MALPPGVSPILISGVRSVLPAGASAIGIMAEYLKPASSVEVKTVRGWPAVTRLFLLIASFNWAKTSVRVLKPLSQVAEPLRITAGFGCTSMVWLIEVSPGEAPVA